LLAGDLGLAFTTLREQNIVNDAVAQIRKHVTQHAANVMSSIGVYLRVGFVIPYDKPDKETMLTPLIETRWPLMVESHH
jgi:hypothetical protein